MAEQPDPNIEGNQGFSAAEETGKIADESKRVDDPAEAEAMAYAGSWDRTAAAKERARVNDPEMARREYPFREGSEAAVKHYEKSADDKEYEASILHRWEQAAKSNPEGIPQVGDRPMTEQEAVQVMTALERHLGKKASETISQLDELLDQPFNRQRIMDVLNVFADNIYSNRGFKRTGSEFNKEYSDETTVGEMKKDYIEDAKRQVESILYETKHSGGLGHYGKEKVMELKAFLGQS